MNAHLAPSLNGAQSPAPDPEVKPAKTTRRTFTPQQKLKILQEVEALGSGEIGAYLRRKGIYWATFAAWRRKREEGLQDLLEPKKRGAPPQPPENKRVAELEAENKKLHLRLDQAEMVIDVQKKLCELFGMTPTPLESQK